MLILIFFFFIQEHYEKTKPLVELSSIEVHNLVKEKLKLKGVHINQNVSSPTNTLQVAYYYYNLYI